MTHQSSSTFLTEDILKHCLVSKNPQKIDLFQVETLNSRFNALGQKEISLNFVLRTFSFEILKGQALGTRLSVLYKNMLRKRKVKVVAG